MRKEVYITAIAVAVLIIYFAYQSDIRKSIFAERLGDMTIRNRGGSCPGSFKYLWFKGHTSCKRILSGLYGKERHLAHLGG